MNKTASTPSYLRQVVWVLPPARSGAMCEQCVEIDEKIGRYRRIMLSITDDVTIERFKEVVADLEAKKLALHAEEDQ